MINVKELRIGNYILQEGEEIIVSPFNLTKSNDYEPIPITEEWLTKFGFKKLPDKLRAFKNSPIYQIGKDRHRICWSENTILKPIEYGYVIISDSCKNVHNLQNIYFDLSGKELKQ